MYLLLQIFTLTNGKYLKLVVQSAKRFIFADHYKPYMAVDTKAEAGALQHDIDLVLQCIIRHKLTNIMLYLILVS